MQIELMNCEIEISYIGTRLEIMLFMVGDAIEDFIEDTMKPLAKALSDWAEAIAPDISAAAALALAALDPGRMLQAAQEEEARRARKSREYI